MPMSALVFAPSLSHLPASDVSASEGFMDKSAGKRREYAGIDPQGCVDYLRRLHPDKTAVRVEADTGIAARTVERWLTLDSVPQLAAFGLLVRAYGPSFVAAAMPGLWWVERAADLATHDGLTREIARLKTKRRAVAGKYFARGPQA